MTSFLFQIFAILRIYFFFSFFFLLFFLGGGGGFLESIFFFLISCFLSELFPLCVWVLGTPTMQDGFFVRAVAIFRARHGRRRQMAKVGKLSQTVTSRRRGCEGVGFRDLQESRSHFAPFAKLPFLDVGCALRCLYTGFLLCGLTRLFKHF